MRNSWPVWCLLAASACSSSDSDEQAAPLDPRSSPVAATEADAANATPEAIAFLQTFAEPDFPTPDTTTTGSFAIREGCTVFLVAGRSYRAVLPFGSRLAAADAIQLGDGRRIRTGRTVTVKGAEGDYGDPTDIPARCPRDAILIGDVP